MSFKRCLSFFLSRVTGRPPLAWRFFDLAVQALKQFTVHTCTCKCVEFISRLRVFSSALAAAAALRNIVAHREINLEHFSTTQLVCPFQDSLEVDIWGNFLILLNRFEATAGSLVWYLYFHLLS